MNENNENGKLLKLKSSEHISADLAISMIMRNLFATYGEDKVRASVQELFQIHAEMSQQEKSHDEMAKWIEETAKGSISF